MNKIKKFLIPSFAMAGIVASNSLSAKTATLLEEENIDDWAKDQFERDQHFMMAGHSSHASHGSHRSHSSHRSSSTPSTPIKPLFKIPDPNNDSTRPSNPLPLPKKLAPGQKVTELELMKVQAYLSGMNLYRGDIDGVDGPLTREAIIKYQTRYGLSRTGIVDKRLLRHMGLN